MCYYPETFVCDETSHLHDSHLFCNVVVTLQVSVPYFEVVFALVLTEYSKFCSQQNFL